MVWVTFEVLLRPHPCWVMGPVTVRMGRQETLRVGQIVGGGAQVVKRSPMSRHRLPHDRLRAQQVGVRVALSASAKCRRLEIIYIINNNNLS